MWRDRVLVGVLVALTLVQGALKPEVPHRAVWVLVTVAILVTLPWRRTKPLPTVTVAFLASAVTTVLLGGEQSGIDTMAAMLLLPYALFRWASGRDIVIGSVVVLAGAGVGIVTAGLRAADALGGLTVLSSAIALGLALRYRARAKARELDQVKLMERERLARELHDTVAHHVSAIAIRAQAGLATAAARPEAATDALRVIETEAARTLTEMRTIVRALRMDRPPDVIDLHPNPGIADLERLTRGPGDGPSVEVECRGPVDYLSPAVGAAIFRLAQESVTNALRHAENATRVRVRVAAEDTTVRLLVCDDGDSRPGRTIPMAGFGISGMIERAALLGGTCAAGPSPGRGWMVTAMLPREAGS